jgi:hypothetical protein
MNRRAFIRFSAAAGAAALSSPAGAQQAATPSAAAQPVPPANPFQQEGNWYKAALHVHTTTSDGDVDVATRLKQYREAGYHVVAVTDHWKTNDLTGFSDDAFLAVNSMEAHPQTGTGAPAHHFVCLDLPHPFELDRKLKAQELVDKVREAGGKVIYAHPYWTEHSVEEMRDITGFFGIEIYNAHCDLASAKGYNDAHADQAFAKLGLFGLTAVDDIHKTAWIDRGWTMVRAKALTKAAVMEAIGAGLYYASSGPAVTDFRIEEGTVRVACSPAAQLRFFFNGAGGGKFFTAEAGKPRTEAKWKFAGGKKVPKWIRAEVIDAEGKRAWTNPLAV